MMAGPAYSAAAEPVSTKIPAPMIAPIPSVTRLMGPRARFSECSPVSRASFISTSSDLVAKSGLPMQLLLQDSTFPQRNPTLHHWSENPASPHAHPSTLVLEEAISQLVRQGPGFALRSRAANGSNRRFQPGKWRSDPRLRDRLSELRNAESGRIQRCVVSHSLWLEIGWAGNPQ